MDTLGQLLDVLGAGQTHTAYLDERNLLCEELQLRGARGHAAGTLVLYGPADHLYVMELSMEQDPKLSQIAEMPLPDISCRSSSITNACWALDSSMVLLVREHEEESMVSEVCPHSIARIPTIAQHEQESCS